MLSNFYEEKEFSNLANIKVISKNEIIKLQKSQEVEPKDVLKILDNSKVKKEELEKIKKQIEYEYKFKLSTLTPTKTSVSEIKRKFQEQAQSEEELTNYVDSINLSKPKFLDKDEDVKLTGAQKGTLIHMCMQRLQPDVEYNKEKISQMVEKMQLDGIINQKEREAINQYKILQFTKSNIWNELKNAKTIFKERPFYIEVNAKDINAGDNEDFILVQGIIDLYYINANDELVLVDYKTDFVLEGEENKLVEKYKKQLELYKSALENALNKKVTRTIIYSVYLSKEIEIIF